MVLANDVKQCPECGEANLKAAYECQNCGWEFGIEGGGSNEAEDENEKASVAIGGLQINKMTTIKNSKL